MKDNSKNNGIGTQKEIFSRYGIKSNKCSPPVKHLTAFEEDMIDLVHQIRFRKVKRNFQRKLKKDLKTIKSLKNEWNSGYYKQRRQNVRKTS